MAETKKKPAQAGTRKRAAQTAEKASAKSAKPAARRRMTGLFSCRVRMNRMGVFSALRTR
jgi:hypothetical protein